jgi:acyl transferase domain-containing protein/NADPH:quinone reductase-like Zn-dependent oxidoreductase/acyl carrier protein
MAFRFPGGGDDARSYWELLERGTSVAVPVPADRWDQAAIYQEGSPVPGKTNAARIGVLSDAAGFDAPFFGVPEAEARVLDPQQRLVLEAGWEAIEDAGIRAETLRDSRTGVFVGVAEAGWLRTMSEDMWRSPYALTGGDVSFVAGRLAYTLGLRGPVMNVNTVCSSSLVAMHHAVKALQDGECDLALAGGVNLLVDPHGAVALAQVGALAPDGACKTFAADADGYGRGEGVALLVLKRLSDAERDGDRILGVIRGSAVNHDGRSSGLTAPSGPAQQLVIADALAAAKVRPEDVDFLECHGTGTKLGDPIEVRAAAEVYAVSRPAERPLWLGSAKTVVGHLEAAAAMAGVVKILLALRHEVLPPTPVSSPNPELPLAEFPLRLATEAVPWPRRAGHRRLAAVSSFGLSGTNAHMVFEEAPARPERVVVRGDGPYVWPVSGRSEAQVRANVAAVASLDAHPADVGASLALHRSALELRAVLVGADADELRRGPSRVVVRRAQPPGTVLLFAGQGAQRLGMGSESYAASGVFRHAFDAAVEALRPHLPSDLRAVVWGSDAALLDRTEWAQPALFAVQVAQAAHLASLGVAPRAVIGHSVGEFAAGYVAGVWSLADAARLVATRGRLMGQLAGGGAMVAVGAAEDVVRAALVAGAEVAAVNAPDAVVLSGDERAVETVAAALAARGARTTRLAVSHAFHSAHMEPALAAWRQAAAAVAAATPKVTVYATSASVSAFGSADYLVEQLRGAVRFGDAVAAAVAAGEHRFVELGARPALVPMVGRVAPDAVAVAAGPRDDASEATALARAAGELWASGESVSLTALVPAGRRVPLPTMAWDKRRYWLDLGAGSSAGEATGHPLLGARLAVAGDRATFESSWSVAKDPWLRDHVVGGRVVVPGAAWLEVLRAAGEGVIGGAVEVADVLLERPVVLPDGARVSVQVQVAPDGEARVWVRGPDGVYVQHASAVVRPTSGALGHVDLDAVRAGLAPLDLEGARAAFTRGGLVYGPAFQGLTALWGTPGRALGALSTPAAAAGTAVAGAQSPALVDAAFQAQLGALGPDAPLGLPFAVDSYRCVDGEPAWAVIERTGDRSSVRLLAADGRVVAEVSGLQTRAARDSVDVAGVTWREDWVASEAPSGDAEPRVVHLTGDVASDVWALTQATAGDGVVLAVGSGAAAAAARGFARSVALESGPKVRVVELPAGVDAAALLRREASATDGEPAVRWVDGSTRQVGRLVPDRSMVVPDAPSWQLEKSSTGELSALRLSPRERRAPGAGEVELEVTATGLNFRDVMSALGVYPGDAGALGYECAGVVSRVGEGAPFAVGDRVMAELTGGFSRYATVDARFVAPIPAGVADAVAAGIPLAFLTALYALQDLAGVGPGDKVLVHAAAGGVGTAAVQVARWLGAEVYGTASPSKWELVRAAGVVDVASSRDLQFAERWKDVGLTVVLDALAGEFVDASLGLLAAGGRFIEMGKTDVRDPAVVLASHGVRYRSFDLVEAGPDRTAELFAQLLRGFAAGALRPASTKVHPLSQAPDVFRTMAGGGHVGKLTFATGAGRVRPDGVVLISGGTGALGLVAADWVSERGARAVALLSRRGEAGLDAVAAERVAELRGRGVRVDVPAVDVTDEAALGAVVRELGLPVRGVIHAAGVLEDALVRSATEAQIGRVVGPKVQGMAALEAVTAGEALDLFVAFTSISGVVGAAGQSAYAAANAWVDERMRERRAAGLPGQSIAWGPWAERGMAAAVATDDRVRKFTPAEGRALLEAVVRRGAAVTVAAALSPASLSGEVPHVLRSVARPKAARVSAAASGAFAQRVGALPASERAAFVRSAVRSDVASVLGLPEVKVGDTTPLQELGMDSLLAVEVRNVLSRRTGERLPATVAFDHPTVEALAAMILSKVGAATVQAPAARATRTTAGAGPIAVVGLSCRFPGGGDDPESYWRLLEAGQPVAQPVPADRWDHAALYQAGEAAPGRSYAARAGFLTDPVSFDAAFFGISDAEARMLDPQQRLVLEVAWEALEDARLAADRLKDSRTGVYVGASGTDFAQLLGDRNQSSPYGLTGTDLSFLPGRLAYTLGLRGPAMQVNTVCSSALVAMHHAVRGLQDGDCDLAIAGGVNLLLDGAGMVVLAQIGALSPDGTCKTFSADADGYGRAEGCALVVLKRLADAERDGDRVLGVIRGSAVNNDGRSSGLTAPSGPAQQVVMREALAQTGFGPEAVDFLECHGTGTRLGDPIEVRAAAEVYASTREASNPLLLGSAKGVVGHLEAAAAMAGVVKILLAFRHGVVPPTPVREVNPELPLGEFPLRIVGEVTPWARRAGHVRRAAISSFGLSGTNAHMVFEEPPARAERVVVRGEGPYVWAVSGRSEAQVRANAERLLALDAHPADVGASLVATRPQLELRAALVGGDADELRAGLGRLVVRRATAPGTVFVFAGQGSQRLGMGSESYAGSSVFRTAFDAAVEALRPHLPSDLRAVVWGADAALLDRTEWAQPALFAVQVAQAAHLASLGVTPRAVIGHSVGEFAAGYVAGVWSLGDAARLVASRGRLMGELAGGGAMVAVGAAEDVVRAALVAGAEVAAVNAPDAVVISGDERAVETVAAALAARGARTTRLSVSHAFHSAHMEPALAAWRTVAAEVEPAAAKVPVYRTSGSTALFGSADYLVEQLRGAVRFGDAVAAAAAAGEHRFVELGSRPALVPMVGRVAADAVCVAVGARDDGSELVAAARAAGELWASGEAVSLTAAVPAGPVIGLPTMAWDKRRHWPELDDDRAAGEPTGHALLGVRLAVAGERPTFESTWSTSRLPWLKDHVVGGRVVIPGAAWLEVLRAAGEQVTGGPVEVVDALLERPVVLVDGARVVVQVQVGPDGEARVFARGADGSFASHASAVVRPASALADVVDPESARAGLGELDLDEVRRTFALAGLAYGPAFRGLTALWGAPGRAVGRLETPPGGPEGLGAPSPTVVDAALQAALGAAAPQDAVGLPFAVERFRAGAGEPAWAVIERTGDRSWVRLVAADGRVVAEVSGLQTRAARDSVDVAGVTWREGWVASEAPGGDAEPRVVHLTGDVASDVWALTQAAAGDGVVLAVGSGAAAAAARGFARSVALESGPKVRVVELPAGVDAAALLRREASATDGEPAVRWVDGSTRQVGRLVPDRSMVVPDAPSWQLEKSSTGELSALRLSPRERRAPGAGEVELEVTATGLNFRDVMSALGVYPGDAGALGYECAGVVSRVGEGAPFAVGDRVMAQLTGGFARFATLDARYAAPIPAGVADAVAAGVPLAFLTALYALQDLAGVGPGDKVLVHAAAGGVGTAAVQVARWLGAEVYGTASPSKWELVRSAGVVDVASSRDLGFAERWKDVGLTVVLDALAGEFVDASLGLLAAGGRFIEMGKTDVRDPAVVLASHGVRYRSFDLSEAGPDRTAELFAQLLRGFAAGALRPASTKVHPLSQAPDVFRTMAGGGHVGKLTFATGAGRVRPDGVVLISGGTGALGLVAADWVSERGARAVALLSRRGEAGLDAVAAERVAELRGRGVRVDVPAVDVTDEAALGAVVRELGLPVRGVIHAAGVLEDALVRSATEAQIGRVVGPKVQGMAALEAVTAGALDLFVAFTSVAGVTGGAGQTAYAAANAWVDERMRERSAAGLPGVAVAWGPWAERGMAATLSADPLVRKFTAAEGRALLEAAVRRGAPATVMAALSPASLTGEVPHVLRSVARARVTRASAAASGAFAQRVGALPASERAAFVRSAVRSDVASVLGLQEAKVGDTTPLQELGMDSLLAVEVRNVLSRRTGERLPATVAFDHPTVEALAAMILGKVAAAPAAEPSARATARTPGAGPIAVVGLSCRFPGGGDDAESYWRLLEAGQPVAQPVPAERWDHAAIYQAGEPAPGRSYASRAGFVTDPVSFDAAFFGISDAEARMLDPQQRMVLELAWEALEDARVPTDRLKDSRTGVYVGAAGNDFAQLLGDRQRTSPYGLTGTDLSFLPGRLAYTLGLRGPAMQVNTVCSSALVAMHHAVRGLQDGDCDLAIAGGVNLLLDGGGMVVLAQIGALSPDGTCKTFSADADGYGRAEGCALVVLKRLADAERDGDRVLGVIRGSAVNNDGRSSGLTAPSGPAQQVVMREALAQTGFGPEAVDFLECHGTGTRLGDPIEVRAAAEVYASTREASNPLLLGSAKGVVGHLEAAAAMAGVVKILLAFRHGVVPPTPVREVNPELPLGEFPLRIVGEVTPWARRAGHVRRAAISSFGLSGTNAHMVFEEPPARAERVVVRGEGPYVWAVSGRSEAQVRANAERLLALDAHPADVAASLLATRAQLEVRGALVGRDLAELRASLAGLEVRRADAVGPVFVFGGQGSQVAGMGAESYAWSPVYRQAFDAAVEACRPWLPEDLRGVVWSADGRLDRTEWTQAGLFCVQVAQAALWRSLGVVPAAVVGHSVGEFAAAVVAGVLPLDVAARLVSVRGRAMGALPAGGAMVAVAASADEVTRELVPGAELAAVNSPRSAVVSGDEDAVAQVAARFAARGVRTTKLVVSHAFHSARMEPALAALRAAAEECRPAAPAVPVVATARSTHAFGTAEYWVDQARTPVWFAEAIARLAAEGRTRFVELGGRPVLGSMIAQSVPESVDAHVVTAADDGGEALAFVRAAAAAWAGGVRLDLRPVVGAGATIGLPAMAWEKRPLWVGATPQTGGVDTQVPLLGVQLPLAG